MPQFTVAPTIAVQTLDQAREWLARRIHDENWKNSSPDGQDLC